MDKAEFVTKIGELLRIAKPHLVSCRLATGDQINAEHAGETFWTRLNPYIFPSKTEEYVVVTCENGYQYFLNVSANSLAAIAEEVFCKMVGK